MTPRTRLAWVLMLAACGAHAHKSTTLVAHQPPLQVASDPQLVSMTVEPTTDLLLANATTPIGIRVLISAKELDRAMRPPLNLGLVLDTSGSMEGDAIKAVRDNARALVQKLRDGDHISIVAFHSRADVLVKNTAIDAHNRGAILAAVDHITAKGTTALYDGLAVGMQELYAQSVPNGINRLVLLSDGIPNEAGALPNLLAQLRSGGVSVTSLGLGIDYDTRLMTQIARDTGGSFHYIEKPEEVAQVFDEELTKMTQVVAQNLVLTLQPGPGVEIQPLPGFQPYASGFQMVVGDLASGEVRDLMIPVKATARGDGTTAEIIEANLAFVDVINKSGTQQREGYAGIKVSSDAAKVKAALKITLEATRIRANASAAILDALNLARQGQIPSATKRLDDAAQELHEAAKKFPDEDFKKLLADLQQLGKQVAQMRVPPPPPPQPYTLQSAPVNAAPAMAEPTAEPAMRRVEEKASATITGRAR